MAIKPLEDKILVQALEAETTTASGLVIPDTAKEKPQEGTVVAVGQGRFDEDGDRIPMDIKEGDKEAGVVTGLGWVTLSAVLCNWLVALGVIMSFSSTSTSGKILAIWLPILTFFALGYEHAVVNHFTIPAGMMLGADVSIADWLLWNQIPVHVGNFIGGITLAGLGLYFAQRTRVDRSAGAPAGHPNPPRE